MRQKLDGSHWGISSPARRPGSSGCSQCGCQIWKYRFLFILKERGANSNLQVETLPGLPKLAQLSVSPLAPRRLINFHENNQMLLSKPCSSPLSLGLPRSSLIVLRQFCPTAVGCSLHGSGHWSRQATTGVFQWFDSWWVNWSFGKCSKEESEEE